MNNQRILTILAALAVCVVLVGSGCGSTSKPKSWQPVARWNASGTGNVTYPQKVTLTSDRQRINLWWGAYDLEQYAEADFHLDGDNDASADIFGSPDIQSGSSYNLPPGDYTLSFSGQNAVWVLSIEEYR